MTNTFLKPFLKHVFSTPLLLQYLNMTHHNTTETEALEVRRHFIYDLLSVWTKEIKLSVPYWIELHHFFSIALNHIVLNRIEIGLHCIVIGVWVNHIAGSCFACIFNVSYHRLCIEMHVTLACYGDAHP